MIRDAQATRKRLVGAARKAFSEHGYEGTTVREIAADAKVNPALINRYFGGKEQLFAEAVSIDLAFPDLSRTKRDEFGRTLIAHFFRRWEGGHDDDLLRVLIRTAATNQEAASRVRAILAEQVSAMVERVAGPARARERACLIATQILGLAYARYVLGISDADVPHSTMVDMVGGTIQRYLVDPLP
ncbi:TetR family transcriptional regulator [Mesorhizobium sp. L-8-10]|uniref:TetR/AcrR family transcriptional regulator n=1 Tax=unclassified Mesorhizobium TaxID=325217 RepID=UPI001925FBC8|nr:MULTISPECIES: TetR family transcriptional regulator [unclassified Mesorhizobium]BCH20696.1 TetR family transcriptional regulator [Mesorhizobium sp. L-8-3]BCH28540.1 TetR family transcriptional regulator [Mesorhizobium sp. L-8-10]